MNKAGTGKNLIHGGRTRYAREQEQSNELLRFLKELLQNGVNNSEKNDR